MGVTSTVKYNLFQLCIQRLRKRSPGCIHKTSELVISRDPTWDLAPLNPQSNKRKGGEVGHDDNLNTNVNSDLVSNSLKNVLFLFSLLNDCRSLWGGSCHGGTWLVLPPRKSTISSPSRFWIWKSSSGLSGSWAREGDCPQPLASLFIFLDTKCHLYQFCEILLGELLPYSWLLIVQEAFLPTIHT